MRIYRYLLVLLCSAFTVLNSLQAQNNREIVLKAMEDELNRSMNDLSLENHDGPFFISYRVFETKGFSVMASLGAINNRNATPLRRGSVRLIVGDYDFNDESFTSAMEMGFAGSPNAGFLRGTMPVDADYYGIRRHFWNSTEEMYRRAAKSFKGHKAKLEKEGKNIDDTPHLVFSKVPVESYESPVLKINWNEKDMADRAREISAIFLDYPEIESSRVFYSVTHNTEYFISSEGARIVEEEAGLILNVSASSKQTFPNFVPNQLKYEASSFDELPTDEEIRKDIAEMITGLVRDTDIPQFEDSYEGPVLFYNKSVASLFARQFIPSLNASESATIEENTSYRNRSRQLDHKIGKRVTSRDLTVSVLPGAQTYMGQKMKGAYRYDLEGVRATDSLMLIEKGYLRELMRGRTVMKGSSGANGTGLGAGVLSVVSHDIKPEEELKRMLIELAEDEGLEYALIVREMPVLGRGVNIYKVSLEDGTETLLGGASLNDLKFNSFRKLSGTSAGRTVHHLPDSFNGRLVSVIAPGIMLLEDVEVEAYQNYGVRKQKEPLVKNPLFKED